MGSAVVKKIIEEAFRFTWNFRDRTQIEEYIKYDLRVENVYEMSTLFLDFFIASVTGWNEQKIILILFNFLYVLISDNFVRNLNTKCM